MAIDTQEKRAAVLGVARPWMRDKFSVAVKDAEWRASSGNTYGGNPFAAPAVEVFTEKLYPNTLPFAVAVFDRTTGQEWLIDRTPNDITVKVLAYTRAFNDAVYPTDPAFQEPQVNGNRIFVDSGIFGFEPGDSNQNYDPVNNKTLFKDDSRELILQGGQMTWRNVF